MDLDAALLSRLREAAALCIGPQPLISLRAHLMADRIYASPQRVAAALKRIGARRVGTGYIAPQEPAVDTHTPAAGDRYVLPSGLHVRIKHISCAVEAICEYVIGAGREVLTVAFLADRCKLIVEA